MAPCRIPPSRIGRISGQLWLLQGKYSYFRLKHEYVTGCSGSRPAQIGYWIVDCQPFRAAPVPLVLPRTCAATSRTGISPLLRTTRSSSTRFYTCSTACRRRHVPGRSPSAGGRGTIHVIGQPTAHGLSGGLIRSSAPPSMDVGSHVAYSCASTRTPQGTPLRRLGKRAACSSHVGRRPGSIPATHLGALPCPLPARLCGAAAESNGWG